jgi:ubiquinone/menaquinone biosynthesis C-methylase UbiE
MKKTAKLFDYQSRAVEELITIVNVDGKRGLEIGCGGSLATAEFLTKKNIDIVICLDNRKQGIPKSHSDQIVYISGDARNLPFGPESFDFILGIAVLEHLPDLEYVAAEIYRVLKPGGTAYMTGGPLWTCHLGHHVYVVESRVRYCFNEKNNPIPDWGHLLLDRAEMSEVLLNKGLPKAHVETVIKMIYDSDGLNRYTPAAIKSAFSKLPFEITHRQYCWKEPTRRIRDEMNKKQNFIVDGIGISELQLGLVKR